MNEKGMLYIVGTPIGNLGDISQRALSTLLKVDVIAAEDTRNTIKLLSAKGISTPLMSYYEGQKEKKTRTRIIKMLLEGKSVALVSDAGSPGISDPGYEMICDAVKSDILMEIVPGPSAVISALQLSGLPTDRFSFFGFLPRKGNQRKLAFEKMAEIGGTIVLYESPRRLLKTLDDLKSIFPKARAAVCREMTKIHEETVRGEIEDIYKSYKDRNIKGEIVIAIHIEPDDPTDFAPVMERVLMTRKKLNLSDRDAAFCGSIFSNVSKNKIYKMLLEMKKEKQNGHK